LACAGCGKIDYPDDILNARLTPEECVGAALECGAPVVSVAGGEPLLHREIDQVVQGLIDAGKFVYLCSNGLLMDKKLDLFKPSPNFTWQVHLDGGRDEHDEAVSRAGTFDAATKAIVAAKSRGFRVNINCTLFSTAKPDKVAAFLDDVFAMGVDGVTISPGYAYERAPDTQHFLDRLNTKTLFRDIFRRGQGKKWVFNQSPLFLDFLAGNSAYRCSPWAMPTRNVFGWQKPCYLLGEGYVGSYRELIDGTDWSQYGVGNYEKCANCMVHCGFEGTAVTDAFAHPLKALRTSMFGPNIDGPMAADVPLDKQRPAQHVFEQLVHENLSKLVAEGRTKAPGRRAQG
jgi:hopanoid biosynthesis associated radical SAM protein HpnH